MQARESSPPIDRRLPLSYTANVSIATYIHTDPDSDLREVSPRRDLFACGHVRVAVALERGFQVLQLLTGEVCTLTTLATAAGAGSRAAGARQ